MPNWDDRVRDGVAVGPRIQTDAAWEALYAQRETLDETERARWPMPVQQAFDVWKTGLQLRTYVYRQAEPALMARHKLGEWLKGSGYPTGEIADAPKDHDGVAYKLYVVGYDTGRPLCLYRRAQDWFSQNRDQADLGGLHRCVGASFYFHCVLPSGTPQPPAGEGGGTWKKKFGDWEMTLERHGGTLCWVLGGGASLDSLFVAGFQNATRDLLTYETAVNLPKFRKTNQARPLGIYTIGRDDVRVWIREGVDAETRARLLPIFFPKADIEALVDDNYKEWAWKVSPGPAAGSRHPTIATSKALWAARDQIKLRAPGFALFPYNYYDNSQNSRAIGTKLTSRTSRGRSLRQLQDTWTFWRTASRSTFVRLKTASLAATPTPAWAADQGQQERDRLKGRDYTLIQSGAGYSLGGKQALDVGIKTGVDYIGYLNQPTKDQLEALNVRACLRSDYLALVDEWMAAQGGARSAEDVVLKFQTEILTVTERPMGSERAPGNTGIYATDDFFPATDGFQVRDLGVFNTAPGVFYFPPLSMPAIGLDLKTLRPRWAALHEDPQRWAGLWKRIYARPVACAKVLALLRYGFQHIAPHGQNVLIELKDNAPAGSLPSPDHFKCTAVIIRDLGDVGIHTDVTDPLWASVPKVRKVLDFEVPGRTSRGKWTLNEEGKPEGLAETIYLSTHHNPQYGAAQVNLHWVCMSAIVRAVHIEQAQSEVQRNIVTQGAYDPADYNPLWRDTLAGMCRLGIEHQRAFVECFERQLGVMLPQIDWSDYAGPDDYGRLGLSNINGAKEIETRCHAVETAVGALLHAFLKSALGKQRVVEYHGRRWQGCPVTTEIKVEQRNGGQPLPGVKVKIDPIAMDPNMWSASPADAPADACPCKCDHWSRVWPGCKAHVDRMFAKGWGVRWTDDSGIIRLYGPAPDKIRAAIMDPTISPADVVIRIS
jgi:hypothetical protein